MASLARPFNDTRVLLAIGSVIVIKLGLQFSQLLFIAQSVNRVGSCNPEGMCGYCCGRYQQR